MNALFLERRRRTPRLAGTAGPLCAICAPGFVGPPCEWCDAAAAEGGPDYKLIFSFVMFFLVMLGFVWSVTR